MPARPKFDEAAPKIVDYLKACVPRDVAAEMSGVSRATFYAWMKEGRKAKSGKKHDWAREVDEAIAGAEAGLVMTIAVKAKAGDVKSAMWLLERSHGERWARKPVSGRVAPGQGGEGAARPPVGGEGEGDDWDLDNVVPFTG
ncbi:MAG: hypothetical protein ITG02_01150 [Patulibacter sp.]|nr:hypothetical protein [Patulibacter sp.]